MVVLPTGSLGPAFFKRSRPVWDSDQYFWLTSLIGACSAGRYLIGRRTRDGGL